MHADKCAVRDVADCVRAGAFHICLVDRDRATEVAEASEARYTRFLALLSSSFPFSFFCVVMLLFCCYVNRFCLCVCVCVSVQCQRAGRPEALCRAGASVERICSGRVRFRRRCRCTSATGIAAHCCCCCCCRCCADNRHTNTTASRHSSSSSNRRPRGSARRRRCLLCICRAITPSSYCPYCMRTGAPQALPMSYSSQSTRIAAWRMSIATVRCSLWCHAAGRSRRNTPLRHRQRRPGPAAATTAAHSHHGSTFVPTAAAAAGGAVSATSGLRCRHSGCRPCRTLASLRQALAVLPLLRRCLSRDGGQCRRRRLLAVRV